MKRTSCFFVKMLIAAVFISSCSNKEKAKEEIDKPVFSLIDAKKEIEAANRNFMELVVKGDSAGIASLYTVDAKLMFASAPATIGRAGIQSVFGGIINSGVTKVDLKTIDLFGNEDLLVEEGAVIVYVKDVPVAEEKSIILWKKEGGKWKLFRDIANSNSGK